MSTTAAASRALRGRPSGRGPPAAPRRTPVLRAAPTRREAGLSPTAPGRRTGPRRGCRAAAPHPPPAPPSAPHSRTASGPGPRAAVTHFLLPATLPARRHTATAHGRPPPPAFPSVPRAAPLLPPPPLKAGPEAPRRHFAVSAAEALGRGGWRGRWSCPRRREPF